MSYRLHPGFYPCMAGPGLKAVWYATEVLGKLVGMGKASGEVSESSSSMLSEVRMALSNHHLFEIDACLVHTCCAMDHVSNKPVLLVRQS